MFDLYFVTFAATKTMIYIFIVTEPSNTFNNNVNITDHCKDLRNEFTRIHGLKHFLYELE